MGDIIGKMTISDPNPELQSCYESIVNLHAPLKKSSIKLLSQPAEKLEAKDIGDLHFSIHGLPFWLKENYQGGQQSSQYRYLSDWLNQFYIPFIRLCLSTHVPNGVFIVNIGNIKFGKEFAIEKDFKAKEIDLVSSSEKIIQQFGTFARLIAKKSYPVLNMNNKRLNQSNTSVLFVVQRNSNPLININEIKYQSDVSTTKTSQVQKYSHQKRKKEEISLPTEIIGDEKRTLDDGKRTIPTPPSVGVVSLGTESSALATGVPNIPEGLKYVKVPGDGHCLYYAIGHYVNKDQKTLRALVADRLEKQDADLSKFILLRADQSIEEYIKDIRNEKEWAGHVEIQVLMKIFERPIVIIGPNGGIKNQGQYLDFADKDPIFVYYNGHTHYDALLVEKNNGKSILKKLESAVTSSRTVSTSQLFSSSSTSSLSALSSQKEV